MPASASGTGLGKVSPNATERWIVPLIAVAALLVAALAPAPARATGTVGTVPSATTVSSPPTSYGDTPRRPTTASPRPPHRKATPPPTRRPRPRPEAPGATRPVETPVPRRKAPREATPMRTAAEPSRTTASGTTSRGAPGPRSSGDGGRIGRPGRLCGREHQTSGLGPRSGSNETRSVPRTC